MIFCLGIKHIDFENLSTVSEETRKEIVSKILSIKTLRTLILMGSKQEIIFRNHNVNLSKPDSDNYKLIEEHLNTVFMDCTFLNIPFTLRDKWTTNALNEF